MVGHSVNCAVPYGSSDVLQADVDQLALEEQRLDDQIRLYSCFELEK